MIYVTHDQVEAMTLADKIVVLREGRIEQAGAPLDLYDDPDNLFVAGFIGSPRMNFFEGRVTENGGVRLSNGHVLTDLPSVSSLPSSGTEVVAGCRPEHLLAGTPEGLVISTTAVEHLGNSSFAYAARPDGEPVCVELKDRRDITAGSSLTVAFPAERTLLFEKHSGQRIR
jgi:lactose/L-arabinose transport system ATP-binding protein